MYLPSKFRLLLFKLFRNLSVVFLICGQKNNVIFFFLSLTTYYHIHMCRVPFRWVSFTVDVSEPKPNRPNTMNLVERRAQELGLCEDFVNGQAGSLGSKIVNDVDGGEGQSPSSGLVRWWVLLLLLWCYTTRAFWCLLNCHPSLREISLVIYSSLSFILAVHLSIVHVAT